MLVDELIEIIEEVAPLDLALGWDQSGVLVASPLREIKKIALALDPTFKTLNKALELGVDFLLTHHPLALKPRFPNKIDGYYHLLQGLLEAKMWLYAAHTSLDANIKGPVGWLASSLGLTNIASLQPGKSEQIWRIHFSPPLPLKRAGFLKELKGVLASSEDERGVHYLDIYAPARDFVLEQINLWEDFKGLVSLYPLSSKEKGGLGLIGDLPLPFSPAEFLNRLKDILEITCLREVGGLPRVVERVAYCPGSGADLGFSAFKQGADVYITGDVKYHQAQELAERGWVLDVGHFILEEKMMFSFYNYLKQKLDGVEVFFIEGEDPFGFI
ncbi:MAG: Uncharacterized protein XD41_0174 [Desulfonauticus sp. 38_4375]|nr:MAG: Uncharacterized protein XD41_0174 [Desulfonauticus sp. 38_4375]